MRASFKKEDETIELEIVGVTSSAAPIDVTSLESVGGWRDDLIGAGVKRLEFEARCSDLQSASECLGAKGQLFLVEQSIDVLIAAVDGSSLTLMSCGLPRTKKKGLGE